MRNRHSTGGMFFDKRIWCAASILLVMLALSFWLGTRSSARQAEAAPSEISATEENRAEAEANLADFERSVQQVAWRTSYETTAISHFHWSALQQAGRYCERLLDRKKLCEADPLLEVRARLVLARIYAQMRDYGKARENYARVIDWGVRHQQGAPRRQMIDLYAQAANELACLSAETGNLVLAEQSVEKAIAASELAAHSFGADERTAWLQVVTWRNLGLIREADGRDGTDALRASTEMVKVWSRQTLENFDTDDFPVPRLSVDTHHLLAEVLHRRGESAAAQRMLLETEQQMDQLQRAFEVLSSQMRSSIQGEKYRILRRWIRENRELVESHSSRGAAADADETSANVTGGWKWLPLHWMTGVALHPDLLVRAQMAGEYQQQHAFALTWTDGLGTRDALLEIVRVLTRENRVLLIVRDQDDEEYAREQLSEQGVPIERVEFLIAPTRISWIRDFGPRLVQTTGGGVRVLSAHYSRFEERNWDEDDLPLAVARLLRLPVVRTPIIADGGALLTNGAGLCLFSADYLELNKRAGLSEEFVTASLKRITGASEVIYLRPLHGEPTRHVDWFVTFPSADTVLVGDYTSIDHENARLLDEHARRLAQVQTASGPLRVVRIPMPPHGKDWFGGTYTNVVYANRQLLVPTWKEASPDSQQRALDLYRELCPDREIVAIPSDLLGKLGGSLHCAVLNLPHPVQVRRPAATIASPPAT